MSPIHHIGRSKKRLGDRLRFTTFRVQCFLWIDDAAEPEKGFGFAADLSEDGAGVYLDRKVPVGTPVRMAFETETGPQLPGFVAWSQRYAMEQKFHGHGALDHRLGMRFAFTNEADRQRYLLYFKELKQRVTIFSKDPLF